MPDDDALRAADADGDVEETKGVESSQALRESKSPDDDDGTGTGGESSPFLPGKRLLSWTAVGRVLPAVVPPPPSLTSMLVALKKHCDLLLRDVTSSYAYFAELEQRNTLGTGTFGRVRVRAPWWWLRWWW